MKKQRIVDVKMEQGKTNLVNVYLENGKKVTRKLHRYKSENAICYAGHLFQINYLASRMATDNPDDLLITDLGEYTYDNLNKKVGVKEPEAVEEVEVEEEEKIEYIEGKVKHYKYDKIKTLVEEDIPVLLIGPAGSGKNYTLEQIAEELGLEFHFTNSVQQEYKLTGFIDAGGKYHETEFYRAFANGGLFFLDELDASIPEVLVLLNAAIANKYFEFPTGKEEAHPDFRVVAAGNTTGDGADEQYTGRLVLDQATLDRFAFVEFDYCRNVETMLSQGDLDLLDFIRDIRQQAKENGIRATFSYRAIIMVTKLNGKLKVEEILKIAVFKGLDQDTINTFRTRTGTVKYTRYHKALDKIKEGA